MHISQNKCCLDWESFISMLYPAGCNADNSVLKQNWCTNAKPQLSLTCKSSFLSNLTLCNGSSTGSLVLENLTAAKAPSILITLPTGLAALPSSSTTQSLIFQSSSSHTPLSSSFMGVGCLFRSAMSENAFDKLCRVKNSQHCRINRFECVCNHHSELMRVN